MTTTRTDVLVKEPKRNLEELTVIIFKWCYDYGFNNVKISEMKDLNKRIRDEFEIANTYK